MDNHYDLLLETPLGNLSQILHHINGAYTAYFNAKRRRVGHLFQGRYKAISEYPWSSYAYYVGKQKTPAWLQTDFVLGYFGDNASKARKRYRQFVEGAAVRRSDQFHRRAGGGNFQGAGPALCTIAASAYQQLCCGGGLNPDGRGGRRSALQDPQGDYRQAYQGSTGHGDRL